MRFGLAFILSIGIGASALAAPWDNVPLAPETPPADTNPPIAAPLSMQRGGTSETLQTLDALTLSPFATSLGTISAMTVSESGTLYVSDKKTGRIWALSDRGNDGEMDIRRPLAQTFQNPTGLAIIGETLYVADRRAVWALGLTQNTPPRLLAPLANAKSLGDHPLTVDGEALILGITQQDSAMIVRVDTSTGHAEKVGDTQSPLHSLAKRKGAALWVGTGRVLQAIDSPATAIIFTHQTISGLMLPGQYSAPNDWPITLKDHIIAAQSGPKAMQLIAVPTEFGQPSGPPRILVDGFLSSTGRSAWGTPGAMVMDKRGLFFADRYNGTVWRLSVKPSVKDTPQPEVEKVAQEVAKEVDKSALDPAKLPPSQRPLLIGSGIKGSQIGDASLLGPASQLETGSTIIDAYEKAEAEAAALKEKDVKKDEKPPQKTYRSKR